VLLFAAAVFFYRSGGKAEFRTVRSHVVGERLLYDDGQWVQSASGHTLRRIELYRWRIRMH